MEQKTFKLEIKELSEAGEFEGYASIYGIVDLQNEVVDRGAFNRTLQHKKGKVFLLDGHDPDKRIGVVYLEDTGFGLKAKGILNLAKERAREVYEDIKFYLSHSLPLGMSIGFKTIKDSWEGMVRHLKELALWEVSVVTFPALEPALIEGAKENEELTKGLRNMEIKGVVPYQDWDLAEENTPWDAREAESRVRKWAGGEENMNWEKYRSCFFWYDSENPENFTAYKLQYVDIINGTPKAIPRAIYAVATALQGARGGVNIPNADKEKIKNQVEKYYKKLDRTAPWDEKSFELKYGKVISSRNLEKIKEAIAALQDLVSLAESIEDSVDDHSDNEKLMDNPSETKGDSETSLVAALDSLDLEIKQLLRGEKHG